MFVHIKISNSKLLAWKWLLSIIYYLRKWKVDNLKLFQDMINPPVEDCKFEHGSSKNQQKPDIIEKYLLL